MSKFIAPLSNDWITLSPFITSSELSKPEDWGKLVETGETGETVGFGKTGEFVDIVPAQQKHGDWWYKGTADAVYQNVDIIEEAGPERVLILAGDHVYKMDYGPMVGFHAETKADLTVGVVQVPRKEATGFGVMTIDEDCGRTGAGQKPIRIDQWMPSCFNHLNVVKTRILHGPG